ncbi:hypothetical protein DUPY_02160 [Duganella phyllosphaerae]|uniref:Uncharacterized protein n=1 Tax=Duganella phyllosphaerae TaxID=762836 RepID=A0A1E7X7G3_9BURK|nr:hypothetical protein DUPY_02160 [Duganella phyllosphaerae]
MQLAQHDLAPAPLHAGCGHRIHPERSQRQHHRCCPAQHARHPFIGGIGFGRVAARAPHHRRRALYIARGRGSNGNLGCYYFRLIAPAGQAHCQQVAVVRQCVQDRPHRRTQGLPADSGRDADDAVAGAGNALADGLRGGLPAQRAHCRVVEHHRLVWLALRWCRLVCLLPGRLASDPVQTRIEQPSRRLRQPIDVEEVGAHGIHGERRAAAVHPLHRHAAQGAGAVVASRHRAAVCHARHPGQTRQRVAQRCHPDRGIARWQLDHQQRRRVEASRCGGGKAGLPQDRQRHGAHRHGRAELHCRQRAPQPGASSGLAAAVRQHPRQVDAARQPARIDPCRRAQ